jgi:hypothetical protein
VVSDISEMRLLVEVLVKREMATGATETDARLMALGYITSFVQRNLINPASKESQKMMRESILERISIVTGDL